VEKFRGVAATPWTVSLATGDDGHKRPQIIDANGAVLAEVKIGYGMGNARKLAKLFVDASKKWRR